MNSDSQPQRYSARRPLLIGLICIGVLVGGLTAWSLTAKIAGAVIANGEVAIAAGNQPIEHLDGGAVAEVYVRDGDRVARGDPLLRFADGSLREQLAELELRAMGLAAQRNRLEAEQTNAEVISWDSSLRAAAMVDPAVSEVLDHHQAVFDQRLMNYRQRIALLDPGDAETPAQILSLEAERVSEAEALLIAAQPEESSLRERVRQLGARIKRSTLRAPTSGVVFDLAVTGPGDVAFRGEPLMQIVPDVSALIIRARIRPIDIDQVFVGQQAAVRFAAFPVRSSPEWTGRVEWVSADALADPQTGVSYYEADLAIEPLSNGAEADETLPLVPGMPVEIHISTGSRTVMSYLVKPVTDFFNRSLRED